MGWDGHASEWGKSGGDFPRAPWVWVIWVVGRFAGDGPWRAVRRGVAPVPPVCAARGGAGVAWVGVSGSDGDGGWRKSTRTFGPTSRIRLGRIRSDSARRNGGRSAPTMMVAGRSLSPWTYVSDVSPAQLALWRVRRLHPPRNVRATLPVRDLVGKYFFSGR